jgi:hypothetical protein
MDDFFEHARREMFPKLKSSAMSLMILGEPDPKLCLELGAAILFDKPILVIVPKGRSVPLALRTIANKILEDVDMNDESSQTRLSAAMREMMEAARFRSQPGPRPQTPTDDSKLPQPTTTDAMARARRKFPA